jgi:alpha-glucosidase
VTSSETAAPLSTEPADDWRRTAVVYQIYPRSFADADGNGIGDLPGITSHLPQLQTLGVDAVWLSPFYTSPQADAGYDVADYRDVDPLFGTLSDFDTLLEAAHGLGLKVIIDLVPNHSSDEHAWFRAALAAGPGSPERDRYIFRDGKGAEGAQPPNNWVSTFGGPAWTRTTDPDGTPGQWYLHLFDTRQPDWNWDNREIHDEFLSVLKFWLDRGVDGFRIDVANSLIKVAGLPDLDLSRPTSTFGDLPTGEEPEPADLPMWDRDEVHEVYREWRKLLDQYEPSRMLVAEAWVRPLRRLAQYVRRDEMDQAFNFEFLAAPWNAPVLRTIIDHSIATNSEVGAPTTWVLSNHDVVRHASRFGLPQDGPRPNGIRAGDAQPDAVLGLRRARAATLMMLALPGSAYLYQGEELGLPEHTTLDDDLRQDPTWWRSEYTQAGRDGCRVPLPWIGGEPGDGFSPTGKTWLPQPAVYADLAWDRQIDVPGSTLELYRAALRLRRQFGLGGGSLRWLDSVDGVLTFRNGNVTVMTNVSALDVVLPAGKVLASSEELPAGGILPENTTVWLG